MPSRTSQIAQVGRRRVELSNLAKVLFPEDQIVKAQLIEYYLKLTPTILAHIKGRPLSLLRFPEGIHGQSFYQKNRPDWAPDWVEHVTLGEEKKDYVIATEEASLVWLANLAFNRGPLFFHQPRVGKNGKVFEIYKFRSMRALDEGEVPDSTWTEHDDPRITPFGRVLRVTHVD